ncbi:hypothetical protein CAOG_05891 [Capsaspora owczarzaki ATCC 30864]|nr:hypothetical protein CAOG_05891 [Capsaspora owczarzaki ATCC 30864]|eukprot:XP_004345481.1 hypothetical protein CAOG_05891 [Capsaspora owczarzaki ATCC 30864]
MENTLRAMLDGYQLSSLQFPDGADSVNVESLANLSDADLLRFLDLTVPSNDWRYLTQKGQLLGLIRAKRSHQFAASALASTNDASATGSTRTAVFAAPATSVAAAMPAVSGVLDYAHGRIRSCTVGWSKYSPAQCSTNGLLALLSLKWGVPENRMAGRCVTLDLSGNDLFPPDLPHIIRLVEALRCPVLKMNFNRFGYTSGEFTMMQTAADFKRLVALSCLEIVDIVGDPLGSVEWKTVLFDSMGRTDFLKLIFVHRQWVPFSDGWGQLLPQKELLPTVQYIHTAYQSYGVIGHDNLKGFLQLLKGAKLVSVSANI